MIDFVYSRLACLRASIMFSSNATHTSACPDVSIHIHLYSIMLTIALMIIASTYQVYLHKNTFSHDENQRRKAESNVRLAMDEARALR